ncbi:hypothetical protein MRX96_059133 [Rhipicephalus microplus]
MASETSCSDTYATKTSTSNTGRSESYTAEISTIEAGSHSCTVAADSETTAQKASTSFDLFILDGFLSVGNAGHKGAHSRNEELHYENTNGLCYCTLCRMI